MRGAPERTVRIPIAAIMAVIALLAVELAAIRVATDGWVESTRYLTIVTLTVATYLARYRRGDQGAWWFGFALFGWAYLAMVLDSTSRRAAGSPATGGTVPPMTVLGLFVDESTIGNRPLLFRLWWNRYEILQSILILVVASLGGVICWIVGRRRGWPYREEERRAGRLDLGDEAEHPVVPPLRPS